MDISALERRLAEDTQSNNVTPLLVLAEAGSVLTGHCDNITRLRAICDKYNVWLHLRGHSLAALALNNSTKDLVNVRMCYLQSFARLFSSSNVLLKSSFIFYVVAIKDCRQHYITTWHMARYTFATSSCILL